MSVRGRSHRPLALAAIICVLAPASCSVGTNSSSKASNPMVRTRPAIESVLGAFATHPIVAIADAHGLQEELVFYSDLVRDPRFASEIGNVVVEFGAASLQPVIDRYVNGEDVAYSELRKVWTDPVGWLPTVTSKGYADFFAAVRQTNLGLPAERRIRVWLGDPPIDWKTIRGEADVRRVLAQRDAHAASLIEEEILAAGKRALVVYGEAHIRRNLPQPRAPSDSRATSAALMDLLTGLSTASPKYSAMTPRLAEAMSKEITGLAAAISSLGPVTKLTMVGSDPRAGDTYLVDFSSGARQFTIALRNGLTDGFSLRPLSIVDGVERRFPDSFFIVTPYTGYTDPGCSRRFEAATTSWPVPALADLSALRKFNAEAENLRCRVFEVLPGRFSATMTSAQKEQRQASDDASMSGLASDAVLYLGPAAELSVSPDLPDLVEDENYRREISRRMILRGMDALGPSSSDVEQGDVRKWRTP